MYLYLLLPKTLVVETNIQKRRVDISAFSFLEKEDMPVSVVNGS